MYDSSLLNTTLSSSHNLGHTEQRLVNINHLETHEGRFLGTLAHTNLGLPCPWLITTPPLATSYSMPTLSVLTKGSPLATLGGITVSLATLSTVNTMRFHCGHSWARVGTFGH